MLQTRLKSSHPVLLSRPSWKGPTFQWTAQMLSSVPVLPRFNLVLSANFLSSYWENVLQTRLVPALIINNSWDFLWGLTRAFQKKLIFFSNENPSRQLKSAFYFILKAFFVPKIFKLFSWIFWSCRKRLNKKAKVNFKIYDVINSEKIRVRYTYCPVYQKVKAIRQLNLVSQ